MPPILLLHLSDLHFGPHGRFLGEDPERLGKAFHRALAAAQKSLELDQKLDLVVVTGDVAEAGKPSEFEQGRRFLAALAGELGLLAERFVFVPGNHDVNWAYCKRAEADLEAREELTPERLRVRLDEVKLDAYLDFLKRFYGVEDLAEVSQPLALGARLHCFPDLCLAVATLNSCEKESHRKEDHVGLVSREQAESVLAALWRADLAGWLKVLAVHHNPDVTTPSNLDAMREDLLTRGSLDTDLLARYEGDALGLEGREHLVAVAADARVQILLHGHHHARSERTWPWRVPGATHLLSAGSLWLVPDKLPKDEPASARLILLDPEAREVRAESLIYLAWHRVEGSVERGGFTLDPAGGFVQRLDPPPGFASVGPMAPPRPALDVEFLQAFRLRMSDLFTRWDIGSLGALRPGGARGDNASLEDMYVELRFRHAREKADDKAGERKGAPLREEDLLSRDAPVLLQGAAGAGKTTWARYTFSRLARDERALPLMLVLRDVARRWQLPGCEGDERSIDAALDTWIGEKMGAGWKGRLRLLLKASEGPRPILLVDGWDELGPLGGDLRGMLIGFLREHPRVLAAVTTRPHGLDPPSHSDGFEVLYVQPLDGADVETLTRRFFRRFTAGGDDGAERDAGAFLSALERSPEARDLARTPLLLTMMLLVGHSQPLPEKRHLLYDRCIDALLHTRPEQRAAEGALPGSHVWRPPGIEELRRWVAALAYEVQSEGYKKTARAPIVRSWEEMKNLLPPACPRDKRDGFLAWLVEDAGLLVDRADGTLAFAHLSFQEYLTANHLETTAAGPEERLAAFSDRLGDSDWWETLRLLAAQIDGRNPAFLAAVLEGLLATPAEDETHAFSGTVLADGLGPDTAFGDWKRRWLQSLQRRWPSLSDECAAAWRAARQGKRKRNVAAALAHAAGAANWLGYLRLELFGENWAPLPPCPSSPISSALVGQLAGKELSAAAVAAGRLLCGAVPLWPHPYESQGLCQLWPSGRRLHGMRLQGAVAAGASRQELAILARRAQTTVVDAVDERGRARDLAREWAREWENEWGSDWGA